MSTDNLIVAPVARRRESSMAEHTLFHHPSLYAPQLPRTFYETKLRCLGKWKIEKEPE